MCKSCIVRVAWLNLQACSIACKRKLMQIEFNEDSFPLHDGKFWVNSNHMRFGKLCLMSCNNDYEQRES